MKLCLDERLLSEIVCQKDVKIRHPGVAKQRLMHKKILIIVDDVEDVEALNTLTDQTSLVGTGSRIVVITQDKRLLESQKIELIYKVELPSYNLAMQIFCRSAFGKNSPPYGFQELAKEVALHSSNLPLGLSVLGSSLKGMNKEEWVEMLPRLLNNLDGKIKNTLKVCYDRLDVEEQELFLCIACLSDGHNVNFLKNLLGDSAEIGLKILNDKSLIRSESPGTVQMHSLLQMLGKEINRADPINNRRFLTEAEDICDVLTDNTGSGTKNTLAMDLNMSEINEPLFIDRNSFQGMRNLKLLNFYNSWRPWETAEGRLYLADRHLHHFPRKLRLLHWDGYPSKSMPINFKAECLVELKMAYSKLEKLWEGTQFLGSLKEMDISYSADLKEIPDLSKAINVKELKLWGCKSLLALPSSIGNLSELFELNLRECSSLVTLPSSIGNLSKLFRMNLSECTSLVTLPSSIGNLSKLYELDMSKCSNLKFLPADVDLENLENLKLNGCSQLREFPRISRNIKWLYLEETALEGEEDSSGIENIPQLEDLNWKKLRGGVKSHGKLWGMFLSGCESLVQIPDLSMATNLSNLELKNCKSLVMLPSSIRNLQELERLNMEGCTMLEILPVDINLVNLELLDLSGCSKLRNFPQISTRIKYIFLDDTAIEEIPSWIKNMTRLRTLKMRRCKNLKNISAEIFKLNCDKADFSDCGAITTICDHLPGPHNDFFDISSYYSFRIQREDPLKFYNCFNLDQDAQEIIVQSYPSKAVIPGGEVPLYFTHRACGSSLSILLSESSLSQKYLVLRTCLVVGPSSHYPAGYFTVRQSFRGQQKETVCDVEVDACTYEMDHLVLFILDFQIKRVDNSPSKLNNNILSLEFYNSHCDEYPRGCSCGRSFGSHKKNSTLEEIKGCGARIMNISKTYFRESDEESNGSKKKMSMPVPTFQEHSNSLYIQSVVNSGLVAPNLDLSQGLAGAFGGEESDEESNRSKKKMRMTVLTSQEHFNSLSIQTAVNSEPVGPNLELSLGLAGVSSGNFLGDAGASSFDACPGGEFLHF